jgi:hypothetical protein
MSHITPTHSFSSSPPQSWKQHTTYGSLPFLSSFVITTMITLRIYMHPIYHQLTAAQVYINIIMYMNEWMYDWIASFRLYIVNNIC